MKKNLAFVLVLIVLTVSGISLGNVGATAPADTPEDEGGDGFLSTDLCGYVMGVATAYSTPTSSGTVNFRTRGNNAQGCFDNSGYAYLNSTSSPVRTSQATFVYTVASVSTSYTINFATVGYPTIIDVTTGAWSGWGRITDASFPGTNAQRWVNFQWTCRMAGECPNVSKYYVTTNTATGAVSGYAWNDYFGFMNFAGLTQELPSTQVDMYVDVLSSDGTSGPGDVTPVDAPIADGYDYWRVRVEFLNGTTYLGPDDVTSLTLTPHSTGTVYLNQVEDTGDAITESDVNTEVLDPSTGTWSLCSTTGSCVLTETGAVTSWNTFIRSASPTSNMLGLQKDSDPAVDYLGDREGCRWIYYDQYHNVDGQLTQPICGTMAAWYYKADYFYNRVNDRNQYILDSLTVDVTFAAPNTSINTGTYTAQNSSTQYTYTVHDIAGNSGEELSWRPRYQLTDFSALYDAAEHDQISSDTLKSMTLKTTATVSDTSDAFYNAFLYKGPSLRRPGYAVKYQLEVDKNTTDPRSSDLELLVDTASDGDADCTRRTDTFTPAYGVSGAAYSVNYTMHYGQKDAACGGSRTVASTNTATNPTAEQWVCDNLRGDVGGENPQLSCYFTGYLPRIDRHDQPEDMLVIGAINSSIAQEDFLNNDSTLSVLGATDTIKLRNKMFSEIVRDIRGLAPSTATAELNGSMVDTTGVMESLLGGRLLYTEGDVIVDGSSSFSDMTIVTRGNVIIKGNITGGRLGIIAFKNTAGDGGNVYLDPDVTELYTNMFLDGALLSYDGVTVPSGPVEFSWPSTEVREATLLKQLYLNGSVFSHNTVGAAPESSASTSTSWNMGDGTTTTDYDTAREHDLNMLRQYRRCFVVDASGMLTTALEDCDEGELPRTDYGTANGLYNSFILDYSPADELPIFRAQSGLFQ